MPESHTAVAARGLLALCLFVRSTELTRAADTPTSAQTPAQVASLIDQHIDRRLAEAEISASPQADDAEFLRRVTLDLIGRVPTTDETSAFLESKDADKRAKGIETLLANPEYGRHFGILWQNRIVPLSPENTREFNKNLFLWLAEGFNRNRPWSETVATLLLAEGDVKAPTMGYYMSSLNSVERFVQAERVAGSVAQLFLGVNLRCAQCHNHPFARWKQTEFWGVAAFFGRVGYTQATKEKSVLESAKVINKDSQPLPTARADATIEVPGKNKVVKARFLEGDEPALDPNKPFRPVFVKWLTAPENERFSGAAVNRLWAHLLGRGLVNPVDDIHDRNPPSHPELFQILAREFSASGHDQKHLLRCICNSKTYQRTSRPLPDNKLDTQLFSHALFKQLRPEALWDSLALVMDGVQVDPRNMIKSVDNPGFHFWVSPTFNSQEAGEDMTRYTHGVPQMLRMLNSQLMHANPPLVRKIFQEKLAWEQAVERLYLAALARRPLAEEMKLWQKYRDEGKLNPEQTYRNILWVLLNSSEFVFNH